jgi:hypothetical protein
MHKTTENPQNFELLSHCDTRHLASIWRRIRLKAAILSGIGLPPSNPVALIGLSECDDESEIPTRIARLESSVGRIEAKLDDLLRIQVNGSVPPPWFSDSQRNIVACMGRVGAEIRDVLDLNGRLGAENQAAREEISLMAEGVDKFLSGLQQKLNAKERELFFECIATKDDGGNRRVLTYGEIGKRLGITKQAVEKRLRVLERRNPQVGLFIGAVRRPPETRAFSALSPSERRKTGVEESYNSQDR